MTDSILMFLAEHTAVAALLKLVLLVLGFVMPLASLSTWAERRQSAMMQDRLGPNRASIGPVKLWGILHFVADAIKMMFKEDVVPAKVDRFLFALAPVMAIAPVLITFAVIPFGPDLCVGQVMSVVTDPSMCKATIPLQVARMDVGMLFYFALASLAVYGSTLAGWASYNKWSLLGGLRASSQMMSYEVCMGLSLMGVFLVYGSLEPNAIVTAQGSNILNWGIFTQPLAFILFFTAAIAETKRAPFDLPEGEPELIGYFVEYSGMRFGIFFLAEVIETIFLAPCGRVAAGGGVVAEDPVPVLAAAADSLDAAALPTRSADAARVEAASAAVAAQHHRYCRRRAVAVGRQVSRVNSSRSFAFGSVFPVE